MRRICLLLAGFCSVLGFSLLLLSVLQPNAAAGIAPQNPVVKEPEVSPSLPPVDLLFPFPIPGTTLEALDLISFTGCTPENNSGTPVQEAAALLVRNRGRKIVDCARVTLGRGKMRLRFTVECLPPGDCAIVLEGEGQPCLYRGFTHCYGAQSAMEMRWIPGQELPVQPAGEGSVLLQNCSQKAIQNIVLHYKAFLPKEKLFLGGKSRTMKLGNLNPGEKRQVTMPDLSGGTIRLIGITGL